MTRDRFVVTSSSLVKDTERKRLINVPEEYIEVIVAAMNKQNEQDKRNNSVDPPRIKRLIGVVIVGSMSIVFDTIKQYRDLMAKYGAVAQDKYTANRSTLFVDARYDIEDVCEYIDRLNHEFAKEDKGGS